MKILLWANKAIEIDIPEDLDPEDVNDFVVDEIREAHLDDWNFDGWKEIKAEAIANAKT